MSPKDPSIPASRSKAPVKEKRQPKPGKGSSRALVVAEATPPAPHMDDDVSSPASVIDITERRKAEAALRAAYTELEAKNAELLRQADDRVRRIRAEAAKEEAEAAQERSALLAEASSILAGSFDPNETLSGLARIAVARLSRCCIIDMVSEESPLHFQELAFTASVQHPALEKFASFLRADSKRGASVTKVLQNNRTGAWSGIDEARLPELNLSEEELKPWRELNLGSFVIAPLCARGRVLGALSLASGAGQIFGRSEIALIAELAARAALALDNARLYHDAAQARETAEAANASKDQFLAMLSHELRTPLSPVLHTVALLEEDPECPESVRSKLSMIRRNVELESKLIDDLLDLARIRSGKLQLHREAVDAHDLLRHVLEICENEITARGLKVSHEFKATRSQLFADPARLQQIFWNLINNAVKYTPKNGVIRLETSNPEDEQLLRVEIVDTGVGIAADQLGNIFNAFEQVHADRSSGLGLGLAICRVLSDLHGATLEARSDGPGHGSTFIFTVPVASLDFNLPGLKNPSQKTIPEAVPLRLLLVEDHPDTATTLQQLLRRRGYTVFLAQSMAEALVTMTQSECDVLVSDIGLADGSGLDLMPKFLKAAGSRPAAGIALSGFGMPEDIERSELAGFSFHLTKPVDIAHLQRVLVSVGHALLA